MRGRSNIFVLMKRIVPSMSLRGARARGLPLVTPPRNGYRSEDYLRDISFERADIYGASRRERERERERERKRGGDLQIVQHNQAPINPWTIWPYELMTDLELPLRVYVVQSLLLPNKSMGTILLCR